MAFIFRNKFGLPSLPPSGTFKHSTILITGATGGLGLATAVHFINLGATSVIITARSNAKGEAARASIETQTGTVGKGIVKVMLLDMSTLASTKQFADQIKREVKTIDYLLLNAGLLNTTFQQGQEGFEETIQVNVLSTALLGLLLLPWIKEAGKGKAHMGFVTSGLHRSVDIGTWPQNDVLGFFSKPQNWPKGGMYGTSKLLEQYVVNEIAKLAVGKDGKAEVIVNPMCPGMVKSDLGRQYKTGAVASFGVDMIMNIIAKSTEGGARTLVLAALAKENGEYITHYQSDADYKIAAEESVFGAKGQKMQAEVWKEVLAVLEMEVPEVRTITR
ncbi:Short chain dehydrogenase atnD [Hyphodiscus hymeniophilus]|uniref:Short chain dehydrogenase atnD n=1 Tax=Hyphodiscus hymeniophilus TaxID=353542 RepID=A0A9P7AUC8_9HELO|nr:Short chain dehydrogenase atnD [Hyphodiscus hymeniophilus]